MKDTSIILNWIDFCFYYVGNILLLELFTLSFSSKSMDASQISSRYGISIHIIHVKAFALMTQVDPASLGPAGKCCDVPTAGRENRPQLNISPVCIRTMVWKHSALLQGSRPASTSEQHATANGIIAGD
jgi:hypothetical protein